MNPAPSSPEATVQALYTALTSGPGQAVDRDYVLSLFTGDASIAFASRAADGSPELRTFTVTGFLDAIAASATMGAREEKEIRGQTNRFGDIAHVWSTYELHVANPAGQAITRRGINSFQLHLDAFGWLITALIWDTERPDSPIPPQYLPE